MRGGGAPETALCVELSAVSLVTPISDALSISALSAYRDIRQDRARRTSSADAPETLLRAFSILTQARLL